MVYSVISDTGNMSMFRYHIALVPVLSRARARGLVVVPGECEPPHLTGQLVLCALLR